MDFANIIAELKKHFTVKGLVDGTDGQKSIFLSLPILDGANLVESFEIEIRLDSNFPESYPKAFVSSERIPRDPSRHINPDGSACLFVEDESWKFWGQSKSLVEFINGPVKNFFISQIYFECHGKWPFGERAHGFDGVLEYYSEYLGVKEPEYLLALLELSLRNSVPSSFWCPCKSGRKYRDCHKSNLEDFKAKIKKDRIAKALAYLREIR